MNISILNQKGGAGKTTLTAHLGVAAAEDGLSVLLVDSDKQGSLRDWHAAKEDQPCDLIAADTPSALASLERVGAGYDLVLIDGCPAASPLTAAAIKASHAVLVPVQPSPLDLWACNDLIDMIRERQAVADRPSAGLVISRAIAGTRLERELAEALEEFGIDVLDARLHQRVIYPNSMATGRTALDAEPGGSAALEVKAIWQEIKNAWL